jgi:hypothetical protein
MAGNVTVKMPGKGDEKINPAALFTIREATPFEREESPEVVTCIWGAGFRVFPAETLADIANKFAGAGLKLARLTAPNGAVLIVSAERVTDRDPPSTVLDDERTKSVLSFGPGAASPRLRIRETEVDLRLIWGKLGVATAIFDAA